MSKGRPSNTEEGGMKIGDRVRFNAVNRRAMVLDMDPRCTYTIVDTINGHARLDDGTGAAVWMERLELVPDDGAVYKVEKNRK